MACKYLSVLLDCGMTHVTDEDAKKYLLDISPEDKKNIEAAEFGEIPTTSVARTAIGEEFTPSDTISRIEDAIKKDVAYLQNSPWVRKDVQVHGLKYDLVTGLLKQIV